ncbi:hypothetical protein [Rhizorhabdus wittichii]|uniref:hypothetical protein n=1 Tax=Rhizorhabdus wittichii TaxID=160791 RepID=UPI0003702152|nr:hypothetical protein [Rhizorhabdus wittichii]
MSDNLRIWNAVCKTNPAHTKHVNQRGGFTAVSANYQILAATEQFGPIGIGWGYTTGDPVIIDTLITIPVTLWHGSRDNTFGPMWGCEEWKDGKGRVDSDAPKKATTDGLTKLLSQLGFNADVFLGRFDDQKYVAQMQREFAEKENPSPAEMTNAQLDALAKLDECDTAQRLGVWLDDNKPLIEAAPEAVKRTLRAAYSARQNLIKSMDRAAA